MLITVLITVASTAAGLAILFFGHRYLKQRGTYKAADESADIWKKVADGQKELSSIEKLSSTDGKGKKPRVLIVDDNWQLGGMIKSTLNGSYDVKLYDDPDDALRRIVTEMTLGQRFDLMLLDENMKFRGTTIANVVRALEVDTGHRTTIVLITGGDIDRNYSAADKVWRKPFLKFSISENVANIIASKHV